VLICALEINLRQTGTTHPYFALQTLARAENQRGRHKFYVSSDNMYPSYLHTENKKKSFSRKSLTSTKALNLGTRERIHNSYFNSSRKEIWDSTNKPSVDMFIVSFLS
jgi:hypothetical protein